MGPPVRTLIDLDDAFARELPELALPWQAAEAPAPELIVLNDPLALELGLDPAALRSPRGIALLVGTGVPEGAHPVAQAYAGHQFGGWAPRLGDGRALLLGEIVDPDGTRRDLHLKGSGRTPFSRGGDGHAALGPMLREYLISEAMHALGIPTTRSLAVCTTGDRIWRDAMLPGAVLARVASSHLRVGTFQYAAATGDADLLRRLVDMAIDRHHPSAAGAPNRSLALFGAVVDAQAALVARWLHVGFVHGVMNTDNTTISGETIDYGPCAFLDAFDPAATFSSIDHAGRYAFANQPHILQWNLARLAEALLPLVDADQDVAVAQVTEVLEDYPERFERAWRSGMAAKLGLAAGASGDGDADGDHALADDWLRLLHEHHLDHTRSFRALSTSVRGNTVPVLPELGVEAEAEADPAARDAVSAWSARHRARVASDGLDPAVVADGMDRANPVYVPRNHLVEEALAAATAGELAPFRQLLDAISAPFEERPGLERYATPAPTDFGPYQTFCGT